MQAGALNRRIKVQQQETTKDAFGQPLNQWTTVRECWAGFRDLTAREVTATASYAGKATSEITVRWSPSFTFRKSHRVVYSHHTFIVEAVTDADLGHNLVKLRCYELNGTS